MAEEYAVAEAKPDGTIVVGTGAQSQGQGHETTFAQLVADTMDVPFEKVRIVAGDTDKVAQGWGTFASRSMIKAGGAAFDAMQLLIAEGRTRAADAFGSIGTRYRLHRRPVRRGRYRSQRCARELASMRALMADKLHRNENVAWPNGCHVCEVEVDPETGALTLVRYVAVDDVGRAVNPKIVDGQTMGAVAQGLGQALFEHCVFDRSSGQLLSGSLMDYSPAARRDLPNIETWIDDIPTQTTRLVSRAPARQVLSPRRALQSARYSMRWRRLSVTHIDMPATPDSGVGRDRAGAAHQSRPRGCRRRRVQGVKGGPIFKKITKGD